MRQINNGLPVVLNVVRYFVRVEYLDVQNTVDVETDIVTCDCLLAGNINSLLTHVVDVFDGVDEWYDKIEARVELLVIPLEPVDHDGVLLWNNDCKRIIPISLANTLRWVVASEGEHGEVALLDGHDSSAGHWKARPGQSCLPGVVEAWSKHFHGM